MHDAGRTHFTKLSSSLLFALIAGPVCSGFLLPPMERYAPMNVVLRVAIASFPYKLAYIL